MREAKGLSLREVARRSQINPGRLSIIERGVQPTPEETRRILEALERAA
jgi:transcriptional regulator with XRE-family HTH domain